MKLSQKFSHIILVSFLVLNVASLAAENSTSYLDRVRAVVGDRPILDSEVKDLVKRIQNSAALAGIFRVDAKQFTENEALTRLIEERVVAQAVKELDAPVTDSEVDAQIAGILKQNGISLKQMKLSLESEGVPFDSYKDNIRSQLERRNVFDRELRGGAGGLTESDLRRYYESHAPLEIHLHVIAAKPKRLTAILSEARSKGIKGEALGLAYAAEDIGWVPVDSLESMVAKQLAAAPVNELTGPIRLSGSPKLVYVSGRRQGSEEDFQRSKAGLTQEARLNDGERRFALWLDRKKSELQIIVNQ